MNTNKDKKFPSAFLAAWAPALSNKIYYNVYINATGVINL